MKKRIILVASFAIATLIFFSACSKNEELTIENWITGTWELDKYLQQDFKDDILVSESESLNQGKVQFNEDGTGEDIGGNFIGSEFEWSNTDEKLTLISGSDTTLYDIEEYSQTYFIFSLTISNGSDTHVERWFLSK